MIRAARSALSLPRCAFATAVALVAVACGGAAAPTVPAAAPQPTVQAAVSAVSAATPDEPPTEAETAPVPRPTSTASPDRRAPAIMMRLFNVFDGVNLEAVGQAEDLGYPGLIAPLVEAVGWTGPGAAGDAIGRALKSLTGESFGGTFDTIGDWQFWLDQHPDIEAAPGFDGWKGRLHSEIDPRFTQFIYDDVPTRVPLWAVQWGGVRKNGIPSLDDPKFITAGDALLDPEEPVFGVSINGDVRA